MLNVSHKDSNASSSSVAWKLRGGDSAACRPEPEPPGNHVLHVRGDSAACRPEPEPPGNHQGTTSCTLEETAPPVGRNHVLHWYLLIFTDILYIFYISLCWPYKYPYIFNLLYIYVYIYIYIYMYTYIYRRLKMYGYLYGQHKDI